MPVGASSTVDRLWSALVRPTVLGGALLVSGALAMGAPFFKLPTRKTASFFSDPVQATDLLQIIILLGVAVVVLGAGALIQAWLGNEQRASRSRILAILTTGLGAVGVLATWLSLTTDVPATQAFFGLGEQVEYVVGKVRGKPVRIMLPQRVKVLSLERPDEEATTAGTSALLTFELTLPKQRDVEPTTLQVGESIDVDGTRLTFVGTGPDVKQLRAVLTGQSAQSIEVAAKKGGTVRVTLDGPEYEVKDLSLNYMGMGPAVQLAAEGKGAFWVFARVPQAQGEDASPIFEHGLRMVRVETVPAAVMTVGPVRPFEPLVASGALLLLGVGGLMFLGGAMRDEEKEEEDEDFLSPANSEEE